MLKELKVTDFKKTYGEKDLLDQTSFLVREKDRIGSIGTNGTGKTSFLNIVAGIDSSDGDRQTVFYPTDYRVDYLSQAVESPDELTVLQAVFQGNSPSIQTVRAYEEALIELRENGEDPDVQKRYTKAEE